jgi:hypothetical protein
MLAHHPAPRLASSLFAIFSIAARALPVWPTATFDEVNQVVRSSDTAAVDRAGELLHRVRNGASV